MSLFSSLLLGLAASVQLAAADVPVTTTVSIAGIDFTNPADVRKFDARARIAIKEVCGMASPADLVGQNQVDQCRENTRIAINAQRDHQIARATGKSNAIFAQSQ